MQPQLGVTAVYLMSAFATVDIQELLVRLVTVSLFNVNLPGKCRTDGHALPLSQI